MPPSFPAPPALDAPTEPPIPSPETLALLARRRSAKPFALDGGAPTPEELRFLLTLAARVPDHGKLAPFRFLVLEGDGRLRAGQKLAAVAAAKPNAAPGEVETVFLQASLVVAVISRAAPHPKIPEWEQVLSAGAVCQTLLIAAHALGYGGVWLTGWAAYDADAGAALGLAPHERVAGFIHLGRQTQTQPERVRPNLDELVTFL